MIFIKHRINTISKLKSTNSNLGIEIDLRTFKNNIIIDHELFGKSELFEKYLKFYKHNFLIANIKEEGIEKKVLKLIKKNKESS